jgi:hypothetical protein
LGGFADTKRTGCPGWNTRWRDWQLLQERVGDEGARLLRTRDTSEARFLFPLSASNAIARLAETRRKDAMAVVIQSSIRFP